MMADSHLLLDPKPTDWHHYQLSNLCDRVKESVQPVRGGRTPYIGLEHLASGSPTILGNGYDGDVTSSKTGFKSGDILFGKLRPYLRKSAKPDFDGVCSTDILVFRANEKLSSDYLKFLVHTEQFIERAKATTSGVQHPRTSWSSLKEFKVTIPSVAEQKRIVHVLNTVQEAISHQERLIQTTTELKQTLMKKLFTEGLRGEALKETEIGMVPESWEVVRLDEVAKIERGKFSHRPRNDERFYNGQYPFIQTGDVSNCDGYVRSHSQSLNDLGLSVSRLFPAGTIMITIAANIGFTGILTYPAAAPDSLIGITVSKRVKNEYLNYFLTTQQPKMDLMAPRGTQKNINIEFLKPWPVILPDLKTQALIVETLDAVDRKISQHQQKRNQLQDLFRTLLHELMTGERRVYEITV